MTGPTWGIYSRVSTRHQAEDGFSLDEQKETLVAYAERRDWDWVMFEDPGVSGEKLDERPGMTALLNAVDEGRLTGILVVDESRLARDELVAALIRDRLKRAGVKVATPSRGEYDLSDPSDNFAANILAAAHAFEQDLRTAKMKAGLIRAAREGYWPGGPPPYGFRLVEVPGTKHKKLATNEEEAAVLRRVADLIVNHGETAYSIAPQLNAEGIRTRRGSLWRHTNLSWHLRQRHLTGVWTYNQGGDPIEVEIPVIFTEAEWQQLQVNIKGKPRSQRKSRTYALTGREPRKHLYCSCGGGYFGKTDSGKKNRTYYECSRNNRSFGHERCPHYPRMIQTPVLDDLVWDQFTAKLLDEDYLTGLAANFIPTVTDEAGNGLATEQRSLAIKLDRNRTAQKALIREMAETDALDTMDEVLGDLRAEEEVLRGQLADLDHRLALAAQRDSISQQISTLVARAKSRLANPTPELMSEVFFEHRLHLTRVSGTRFEGTASIPLFDGGEGGEVSKGGPLTPAPRRR